MFVRETDRGKVLLGTGPAVSRKVKLLRRRGESFGGRDVVRVGLEGEEGIHGVDN